jgi:hypothetical protein
MPYRNRLRIEPLTGVNRRDARDRLRASRFQFPHTVSIES